MQPDRSASAREGCAPVASRGQTGLVLLAYLALTVWWLWPLPLHLADHVIYPETQMTAIAADVHLITWALAWDTHALLTHPAALFDANIFHPAPSSLAFSEHFLGYVPLFAPTYLLTGNPTLASNVLIVLTFPLCALAMYALARRFVSAPAAFVAGAAFAFCGQRYANLYHLHQLGTFYLPLALLFTERWLEQARWRDAIALAVMVGLQLLSSFYLAYAIALLYAVYMPLALWRWRGTLDRRRLGGLVIAAVAGALPAVLASIPYLELQQLGLVPSGRNAMVAAALDPSVTMTRLRAQLMNGGVGPVGHLLAAVALLAGWRSGAYPRVIAVVVSVAGVVLAAGPSPRLFGVEIWSPYALLFRWLPGFTAVRLPFRFFVMTQLGFALLAGLGLDRLLRGRAQRLAWPLAAATLLVVFWTGPERPPHTLHVQPTHADLPEAVRWLREHGRGRALLEVPVGGLTATGRRMLLSTYHWLPIVDGYSAYPPLTRTYLSRIAIRLPEQSALQTLVNAVDVGLILVHLDEFAPARRDAWTSGAIPGLELVQRWGGDLLFAVVLPVTNDRRALLVGTDRTLSGLPLAPVAAPCPGSVSARLPGESGLLAPGTKVSIHLQIDNASAATWPGFGLYPRYLVQLRTTVRRDGTPIGQPRTTALWKDVPAGGRLATQIDVVLPARPGAYQIELAVVQDGESLERCGLTPALLDVQVGPGANRSR